MMLQIQNVEKKFKKKTVLSRISLQIDSGIYGLLGPNGAGKTTLMRCITGVLAPTRGRIQKPEKIGYLPQKFGMFKQLTTYETLEYFASLKKIPKEKQREIIFSCLEAVNLEHRAKDKLGTLSGGMVRRVGIAQALLGNPDLILFDEPTAGLDPEERLRFHNLLSRIDKQVCVIISTHIVEDVAASCDHIIILNQGEVITQSTSEELKRYASGKVYSVPAAQRNALREPFVLLREDAAAGTVRVLSEQIQPGELVSPSIEDGYIRYIRREV